MKKIWNLISAHRHAITWSILYIATMWVVFYGLFGFDLFSHPQWAQLRHAHLRGFPGLVFGTLIMAMIPIYCTTTLLIIRTKKPIFSAPKIISTPVNWIKSAFTPTPIEKPAEKTDTPDSQTPPPPPSPLDNLPQELPSELRTAYIRARVNIASGFTPLVSAPNVPSASASVIPTAPDTAPTTPEELPVEEPSSLDDNIPLPSDFDIEIPTEIEDDTMPLMSAPTFTDITFDTPNPQPPAPQNPLTEFLTQNNYPYNTDGDIIITDNLAIASHTDPEFWIADTDTWFAPGTQRPSPIKQLLEISRSKNLIPVLYLAEQNILELDKQLQTWTEMGIVVISTPEEITELLSK